jgi:hypothetical protein
MTEKVMSMLQRTTLGIVCGKMESYPQAEAILKSYSYGVSTSKAWSRTAFNSSQVLDKKGENAAIHRNALPLSTTAI